MGSKVPPKRPMFMLGRKKKAAADQSSTLANDRNRNVDQSSPCPVGGGSRSPRALSEARPSSNDSPSEPASKNQVTANPCPGALLELGFQALASTTCRNSSIFWAMAYFSESMPSPVTAEIGTISRLRDLA